MSARYSRVPVGSLDIAGISDGARLLYAWLRQSPSLGVTPGLLRIGVAGLAEEIGWAASKTRRHQAELVAVGRVLFDERQRVVYLVGAIPDDRPRNVPSRDRDGSAVCRYARVAGG